MEKDSLFKVSFIQRSMWLTQKMNPDSEMFNVGGYCVFESHVDERWIKDCLVSIINEQEMLRIRFVEVEDDIFYERCDYATGTIEVSSYESLDVASYVEDQMSKRLSLEHPYMFTIMHVGQKTVIFMKMHHMICDGYSVSIFFDLFKEKMEQGNCEAKVWDYTEYINAEAAYMKSEKFIKDKEFWLQHVKDEKGVAFESCKNNLSVDSNSVSRQSVFIDRDEYEKVVKSLDKTSVFHYAITIIYLLNYVFDNDDFYLGLPILNRVGKEKKVIGPYIKMIPFSVDMSECKTVSDILTRVQGYIFDCYRHLKFPVSQLSQYTNRKGLLYNVAFSYHRVNFPDVIAGIGTSNVYANPNEQQEDLVFRLIENIVYRDNDVELCIDYKKDVFNTNTIDNILTRFKDLFTTIYKALDTEIADVEAMSEKDRQKMLEHYSSTTCSFPNMNCIHDFFEKQASERKDAIAVRYEGESVTYKELENRTRKLAVYLQKNNVKCNTLVGICMERSVEMVEAIIATYRSGGAYVPIDPEYPRDRIEYMVEDSNAEIIIAQKKFEALLPSDKKIFYIDSEKNLLDKYENDELIKCVKPDNWAYMIYTSGSTGRPKGAINLHSALVNRVVWMQKEMQLTDKDVVLQKTPFSFDVSVWEFVWPLMIGATIVMAKPGGHRNPDYLADIIEKEKVTTLHFVPSMLRIFSDNVVADKCKFLKRIICSGEELKADLMSDCLRKFNCDLYNLYGPTEAAIDVSYWKCYARDGLKSVPIGKPIDNIQLYVLNKNRKLLPDGISGELYISGVGLAYGYYNKEELTKEKFVDNTINPKFCQRMYKTADLARYNEQREIEYLGRADFQVKINGLRIELGEIEYQLEKLDHVHQAKVIDVSDSRGNKSLVAYIEKNSNQEFMDVREMKRMLKENLPVYMVPTNYVYLDKLPLSHNGKLDRKALPPLNLESEKREIVLPKNPEEEKLLVLFKEMLEVDELGVEDDFFEYGGTSLKGIQLVSKYEKIELEDLYKYSTVRDIAEYVLSKKMDRFGCLSALKLSDSAKANLICIPYGGGVASVFYNLADQMSDDYNVYAVNLRGHSYIKNEKLVDLDQMSMIIATDICKYVKGDVIVYGHCVGSAMAFEVSRKLKMIGVNVLRLVVGGASPYCSNAVKRVCAKGVVSYYYSNDERVEAFIRKIGGVVSELSYEQKHQVYKWFRHDGRNAMKYFEKMRKEKYKVDNITVILGEDDPLTCTSLKDVHQWKYHAKSVDYKNISQAGHYFIKSNSKEVAELLMGNPA
ncbi:non-ribosomal peptide synthetase [Butyrivibrio sp. M55]|uniref:non-ribosomal peptide synthetase n=1 Tax=Butyrivibrio sp. M55 TaxID=1855323 RepID=UPI0008EE5CA3|nr:non-ribosomal peptide synthetase [Butyrivibrio sp. M55]SFU54137.1 amino acid adenylation domain-containing protein [Butyrivibrio sp. M55]